MKRRVAMAEPPVMPLRLTRGEIQRQLNLVALRLAGGAPTEGSPRPISTKEFVARMREFVVLN
jgi:hypothetical protein